jgi:hypothetical protein
MLDSIASAIQKRQANLLGITVTLLIATIATFPGTFAIDLPTTPPVTPPVTPPTTPTPTPTPSPMPTPPPAESTLEITTNSLGSGRIGRYYFKRTVAVEYESGSDLMMTAENLPDGLSLSNCYSIPRRNKTVETCYVSGMPQEAGEFEVTIKAMNQDDEMTTKDFDLEIKEGRSWFWRR